MIFMIFYWSYCYYRIGWLKNFRRHWMMILDLWKNVLMVRNLGLMVDDYKTSKVNMLVIIKMNLYFEVKISIYLIWQSFKLYLLSIISILPNLVTPIITLMNHLILISSNQEFIYYLFFQAWLTIYLYLYLFFGSIL